MVFASALSHTFITDLIANKQTELAAQKVHTTQVILGATTVTKAVLSAKISPVNAFIVAMKVMK